MTAEAPPFDHILKLSVQLELKLVGNVLNNIPGLLRYYIWGVFSKYANFSIRKMVTGCRFTIENIVEFGSAQPSL